MGTITQSLESTNISINHRYISSGCIGEPGRGRALGAASIKFAGEILQDTKKVEYIINMKKVIKRGVVVGVGNGIVKADGKTIYHAEGLKVGLIK